MPCYSPATPTVAYIRRWVWLRRRLWYGSHVYSSAAQTGHLAAAATLAPGLQQRQQFMLLFASLRPRHRPDPSSPNARPPNRVRACVRFCSCTDVGNVLPTTSCTAALALACALRAVCAPLAGEYGGLPGGVDVLAASSLPRETSPR